MVTREDLTPGQTLAQNGHAIAQFMLSHPEKATQWNNNTLICLSIANEEKLGNLLMKLRERGVHISVFYEPDIGNQLTSIAFEGTEIASKLTSSLPLTFKNYKKQ